MVIGQPIIEQMSGQPLAPIPLHRHATADRYNGDCDARYQKRNEHLRLVPDRDRVFSLYRIEKIAIPVVQPVRDGQLYDHRDEEKDRK